ncbi:MAG: glycosyltransferase [Bacteroidetes bacterium]|nr:glycosyltransferase [Bacteroidota bacterium]
MKQEFMTGLVSIVVASYNHAGFLRQRMDGLIAQTYQDIEIIVIDDCSTDNSREVLENYRSHPKVKLVYREKNGGWVTVSNQGVELAIGEFVIFANCDDDCKPGMIEELVKGMQSDPSVGISFCKSLMIDGDNKILGDDFVVREKAFRTRCQSSTLLSGDEMNRFLLHSCVIPNLSAALIKKQALLEHGFFSHDYKACCDWDLFFRIFKTYSCYYIAEPLNYFRQHNKTIRSTLKGRIEYEEFFRLLLTKLKEIKMSSLQRAYFRTAVMKLWMVYLLSPGQKGYKNFEYHLSVVRKHDPIALIFFVPGFVARLTDLFVKSLVLIASKNSK